MQVLFAIYNTIVQIKLFFLFWLQFCNLKASALVVAQDLVVQIAISISFYTALIFNLIKSFSSST